MNKNDKLVDNKHRNEQFSTCNFFYFVDNKHNKHEYK